MACRRGLLVKDSCVLQTRVPQYHIRVYGHNTYTGCHFEDLPFLSRRGFSYESCYLKKNRKLSSDTPYICVPARRHIMYNRLFTRSAGSVHIMTMMTYIHTDHKKYIIFQRHVRLDLCRLGQDKSSYISPEETKTRNISFGKYECDLRDRD